VRTLKRPTLEDKYLLPVVYKFIIPDPEAIANKPASKCIAIYRAAFSYDVRFPLHPIIMEILNNYELAPAQIVPMSWYNIYSFIATCKLHRLTFTDHTFKQVHTVQKAPNETVDLELYCFNHKNCYMMAIKKKSRVKN